MCGVLRCVAILAVVSMLGAWPASAQGVTQTPQQVEQTLRRFDPDAVAAARSYSRAFDMKAQFEKAIPLMRDNLSRQLKAQNPALDQAFANEFIETFFNVAFVENSKIIEDMSLVLTLEIFSKEELVALDQFYASPIGRSVRDKTPQLMGRLPELISVIQKHVVPSALRAAQEKLKQKGVEVRI